MERLAVDPVEQTGVDKLDNADGTLSLTFIKVNDRQYIELFPEKEPHTDRLNHISIEVDDAGLQASVRDVVNTFERECGITTTLVCRDLPELTGTDFAMEVLQIVREALNNVRKHSKASRVNLTLGVAGKTIEITVEDDGSGFPFSGSYSLEELELLRLGPRSIKRRIRTLGGDLTLESRPMHGAGLKIRIPT